MAWLDLLAEREIATEPLAVLPTETAPLVVLGESDFAAAVRDALRNLHRSNTLRTNPLLRSRMVVERSGADADDSASIGGLRDLLEEAAESLQASPREAKLYRALPGTRCRASGAALQHLPPPPQWRDRAGRRHPLAKRDRRRLEPKNSQNEQKVSTFRPGR